MAVDGVCWVTDIIPLNTQWFMVLILNLDILNLINNKILFTIPYTSVIYVRCTLSTLIL